MPSNKDPQERVADKLAETFDEPVTVVQGAEDTARQESGAEKPSELKEDASTVTPLPSVVEGPLEADDEGVHATISHGRQMITVADRLNQVAAEAGQVKVDLEDGLPHCFYCGQEAERPASFGKAYAVCANCGNTVRFSGDAMQRAFYPAGGAAAVQGTDARSRGLARAEEARAAARERQEARRAERDTRRVDRAAEHGAKAD